MLFKQDLAARFSASFLHKILILIFSALSVNLPAVAKNNIDTPVFDTPKGANKSQVIQRNYLDYSLIVGIDKKISSKTVSGKLTRAFYRFSAEISAQSLVNNYIEHVKALKGKVVFNCNNKACGKSKNLVRFIQPLRNASGDKVSFATGKLMVNNKVKFISALALSGKKNTYLQLDILEVIEPPFDLVTVDQDYLSEKVTAIAVEDNKSEDLTQSADHSMLSRMPGAFIKEYQQRQYVDTNLIISTLGKNFSQQEVQGKSTQIVYQLPRSYSELEIDANYESALTKLSFVNIFTCKGQKCGDDKRLQEAYGSLGVIGSTDNQYYRVFERNKPTGKMFVVVYVNGFKKGLYAEVLIFEQSALQDDQLVISLDDLVDEISDKGHVALDGLLFGYDSDVILADSRPVITTLATYLKENTDSKFYVVGHTDDQGKASYNKKLAEQRANAVVNALVEQHRINASRLTAVGIGEYAPVASNASKSGQKKNRRVELVLRSDQK